MDVTIKKVKFTTLNKTYTEQVRDWLGDHCFSTQYPHPDRKRIFLTFYMVDKGYTLSKVFNKSGQFLYYYCDIMEMRKIGKRRYVMIDLILDLIVHPNGHYELLDIDEFAIAVEKRELSRKKQVYALRVLHEMIQLQNDHRLIPTFIHKKRMHELDHEGVE